MKMCDTTKKNWQKLNVDENENFKLISRANKLNSNKIIYPTEYFTNMESFYDAIDIIKKLNNFNLSISEKIELVVLKFLVVKKMININDDKIETNFVGLKKIFNNKKIELLSEINIDPCNSSFDFLGGIYQMLQLESEKSKAGSYYTPESIISNMLADFKFNEQQKILDPACGSGAFLLYIAKNKKVKKEQLYGFDNDEIAVMIAKVNLIVEFNDKEYIPNIFCIDSLSTTGYLSEFDVVVTNPPWGKTRNSKLISSFSEINNDEFFSFFIVKIFSFLKEKGRLKIVLPESIKNVNVHKEIRKFIFCNFIIKSVQNYGREFKGVFTKNITLDLEKNKLATKKKKYELKITNYKLNDFFATLDLNFIKNYNYSFIFLKEEEYSIIEKIEALKYADLSHSLFSLGIVTGNNKEKIYSWKNEKEDKMLEPVISGKNIEGFTLTKIESFLMPNKDIYQQASSHGIYKTPNKLVYRFIYNRPLFSLDSSGLYTLNSANILIPNIADWDIFSVMAYLNSSVVNFFYKNIFNQIKILKNDLTRIPFPKLSGFQNSNLVNLTWSIIENPNNKKEYLKKINESFYFLYNFSEKERKILERYE